ncbi:DUF2958 domain-containing protein [Porphyrobacter sp. ULC335]|uniref:DUF2958 domain-containing protein n=1 Tax=Porphyrobacter sp. ULC335 TaxID=2854260 RepID=UPI00221F4A05|nr:DUF2958 domain-containing protein [Porphyrobacter sp. ULC335]UYV16668.1 DUF2958 domain-containing protein [Porphyrobacter sp. ULC335]
MELLTLTLRQRLLANGANRGDHVPVVKLFNPLGAATWLISECDGDGDTLFGLADLGFGCPELGCVSWAEIAAVRLPLGLRLARDLNFAARHPLSVYAAAARAQGHITERPHHLVRAAADLARARGSGRSRSPP